jgi:hypothetical protein
VPAQRSFEYAVVRVVPRVEREEFVNAGVLLYCRDQDFLEARVELDRDRLLALCPDVDLGLVEEHLAALPRICRGGEGSGPIGQLSLAERFRFLAAPRSTIIQVGPTHAGLCEDPRRALDALLDQVVRVRAKTRAP